MNNNNNKYLITAATIFVLATMTVSIMATPVVATTITTTTSPEEAGMIELSPRPVYQEQIRDTGQTPINQTHLQITYAGSGTLNLPNGTETTIRTTSSGSGIASMIDNDFAGNEILTTEDGSESATARVYELLRFDMQQGNGRGITIVTFHSNSTGMLAPLDGMILAGITELHPNGTGSVTLWEWQSGIPLPITTTTATNIDETPNQQHATTQSANVATVEGGGVEGSAVANQPLVITPSPSELQGPVEQPPSLTEEQLSDTSEEAPVEEEEEDAEIEEEEEQEEETDCHPSYPDFCIPPPPPNLNCDDVSGRRFTVLSPDPHGLDGRDDDGIGCES